MRYFDSGTTAVGDAQVVLVHGLGNSLQFWVSVAPMLGRSARVVAMDVPGFGKSARPKGNDIGSYVTAMAGLLRHLDLNEYHLVGHSMGSVIAAALARREQSSVASLTLLDGIPFGAIAMLRSPWRAVREPALAFNLASQIIGGVMPLRARGARVLGRSAVLRRLALWPYVDDPSALAPDVVAVALMDNGGAGPLRAVRLARRTPLDDLVLVPSVPVRVVSGEHDRLVSHSDVDMTVERYGAIDQRFVRGSGHWPLLEKPDEVVSYIASYI